MREVHYGGERDFKKETDLAPDGWSFLGRDKASWGEEGTGVISVDPDEEYVQGHPYYHDTEFDAEKDVIHLQIAAFRDRLCPRTLYNLFHKAANPSRIYVRIIQQIKYDSDLDDDGDCWKRFCNEYPDLDCTQFEHQVRVFTVDAETAHGPTDPRSKLSALVEYDHINPEDPLVAVVQPQHYCMQTDSHMDFNKNFDSELIQMFHRTRNDYAVLSTYVAAMEQTDTWPSNVPHLCMVQFTSTWRNWGTKYCENLKKPKMTNLPWGAGLSFQKCHAELNVPYDPYLPNVFDGEELSRGFRFFTFGYDVYTPDQVLVTHDYKGHQSNPNVHTWGGKRHGAAKSVELEKARVREKEYADDAKVLAHVLQRIEQAREQITPVGVPRLNQIMDIAPGAERDKIAASRYGLGDRRTIGQAYQFSGFDPHQKKMVQNRCGNLQWIPFEEDGSNYGLENTLARPIWDGSGGAAAAGAVPHLPPRSLKSVAGGKLAAGGRMVAAKMKESSSSPQSVVFVIALMLGVAIMMVMSRRALNQTCKPRKTARMVV
mmetsp:Transcript_10129/g.16822  ORF Transcript_10129/g.16822 Transcript_10129/m.16822 type:complete len:542 (+) Transcript_10129:125-1750(+)|eukprot:CAMPEP_0119013398 /NCGR_PEP_ID=MMETSP1176-20130426/8428_1 /TAXON_ID=265551 /ORGANISM="Synedropsis recta cf, Strain CCMP1620" /LENGTH=541 /DNA_ID=CAMNT_0006966487 /DNA_START=99 /DNA_END=1724 /DNA_ORIENTATION=+